MSKGHRNWQRAGIRAMCGWLLLLGVSEAGSVYQWRDASGTVHFGDRPPAGVAAKPVALPESSTATKPSRSQDDAGASNWRAVLEDRSVLADVERDAARRRRQFAAAAHERKLRAQRCTRLRRQLDELTQRQRAGYRASAGIRMDARRRELKARLEDACS